MTGEDADKITLVAGRRMILNVLRSYKSKYGAEYGELVLACDGIGYWRKDVFPGYKSGRKKFREKTNLDWNNIYSIINQVLFELQADFPWKIIKINKCEADDVIAVLAKEKALTEKVLILSGDKDFVQLQTNKNIKQFDPVRKVWKTSERPQQTLCEHILTGDAIDSIPNVMSPDDVFTTGTRQTSLRSANKEKWLNTFELYMSPELVIPEDILQNYKRNQLLIDFAKIPEEYRQQITDAYNNYEHPRTSIMDYLIKHNLQEFLENIKDFKR